MFNVADKCISEILDDSVSVAHNDFLTSEANLARVTLRSLQNSTAYVHDWQDIYCGSRKRILLSFIEAGVAACAAYDVRNAVYAIAFPVCLVMFDTTVPIIFLE